MNKNIILFDVETNGFKGSSVLSISAIKVSYNINTHKMEKIDEYNRFYYRNKDEELNLDAIRVNGLTDEEIFRRREVQEIKYPKTFLEDINSFYDFCSDAEHFVAHNIKFDSSFIPFKLKYKFDTMLENVDILGVRKWPKLSECASFYKIPFDDEELHNSMYDVLIMARVMYKMLRNERGFEKVRRFLVNNKSTEMR